MNRWFSLTKAPLSVMVALSGAFGYLLATPDVRLELVFTFSGLLMLAGGAAACNSLQEVVTDGRLARTSKRPLVTGALSRRQAAVASTLLILIGLGLLWATGRPLVPLFGLLSLVCYNLLYTSLKYRTVFALLPGGLAGSMPPGMGWLAAGGQCSDTGFIVLFALFFLWQIPHFGLLSLQHRQDYLNLGKSGLMITQFSESAVRRIVISWLLCCNFSALTFTLLPGVLTSPVRWVVVVLVAVSTPYFAHQVLVAVRPPYRHLFILFNVQLAALMLLIIFPRLLFD